MRDSHCVFPAVLCKPSEAGTLVFPIALCWGSSPAQNKGLVSAIVPAGPASEGTQLEGTGVWWVLSGPCAHLGLCSLWQFRVLFANLVALFWYAYLASLGK